MIYDGHMIIGDECAPKFLTFVLRLKIWFSDQGRLLASCRIERENSILGGEGWLGFPDLWSRKKPWWNWYLIPVVNFCEVRGARLAKSTLLTSTLVPFGSSQDLLMSVQMLKREWDTENNGSYRTYSYVLKLQPWFLSLRWKTCLWAELQRWCLSLQWKTCPWTEHSMMMILSWIGTWIWASSFTC